MRNKKYLIDNKELMQEWDYESNEKLNPGEILLGSNTKVYWICKNKHKYKSSIKNRVNGRNCPYCAGKEIWIGFNDLKTWCIKNNRKDLIEQFDYTKNKKSIEEYTMGTHQEVYWICQNNHSYKMKVSSRTSSRAQCPYCTNHKLLYGYNDLKTWANKNNKKLIQEYSSKNKIQMEQIFPNNTARLVWKCSVCGKEFTATPNSRVNMNSGCPYCAKRQMTSYPEQALYYYLKTIYKDAINGYKNPQKNITEIDIYIPSIKTGIEYDGKQWHKGIKNQYKEAKKYNSCIKFGIHLIRIKEKTNDSLIANCHKFIYTNFNNSNYNDLNNTIKELLQYLNVNVFDVDVVRDNEKILKQYVSLVLDNSLAKKYPDKAKFFDKTKNEGLLPEMFYANSRDLVWWKCEKCNKNYKLSINAMISKKSNLCNECSKRENGNTLRKKVNQYDLNGNLIKTYESTMDAKRKTQIQNIVNCCNRKAKTAGNFIWRYYDDCDDIKAYIKTTNFSNTLHKKKVGQYDLNGKLIKIYESANLAEKENKFPRDSISNCCRKNKNIYKNYIWKYYKGS